mmetsp:Transcript_4325/g.7594  ORF Transcript_4325/g.7594 Transcript_4325/m.7594 type:complete len:412 (-) Transcript_4325:311-1546(-)|eukprot:CAMPEP_0197632884 /NCGR_PEP_ID=MMETSP1338-20131121/9416_1 /TAXON_ID=43686 ORGANISM="Pelagodinium beii, Strain RCC1491" /NCGR_SAMPLE_ID=MMETSP1338 /ASSEMBLY_ACC=CAM_ASM_000754 /LENGTH=411 /DNA_ID=CAMNT_0043204457 /DNA_START=53 /DNA_END=1288 /DNA_ORIENTATION=-
MAASSAKRRKTDGRLPVIILTGYLGAGKTTLLNYILHEQNDKKLAVIENEIGEVSVDDALVEQKHEDLAEQLIVLDNGCICCTIREDLKTTLKDLAQKRKGGLALDGVLVELTGAADPAPVVQTFLISRDIAQAFYIDNVITLVDAKHAMEKLDESKANPDEKGTASAQIAFSSTVLLNKTDLVEESILGEIEKRIKNINSVVDIIRCQQARVPLDKLFGVKVFDLGKVLEEQYMDEDEFNTFYKPKMDRTISNVGVKCEGGVAMQAFQNFLGKYLDKEETAKDFMRVKGVLHIKGGPGKWVLQCVHMLKNQNFTTPWKNGEKRENRIIFIGRGMEQRREELTQGFMACLAQPLRFNVGTKVKAKMGDGDDDYEDGTIIKQWDDCMAYRIKLQSGATVHAPLDEDDYVKAA